MRDHSSVTYRAAAEKVILFDDDFGVCVAYQCYWNDFIDAIVGCISDTICDWDWQFTSLR